MMKLFVVFSLCFYTFGSNAYYTSQSFTHLECKDSNDLVPKDDDGKNRYLLNILEVDKGFLADLRPCDSPVDDKPDPCDPYVIVKIDGKHVYRTKTHNNSGQFEPFNEQVQTGPISNSSIITLELWDNDVGHSHDDPMAKWSGNAQYFLRSTYLYSSGNMIKVDMDHDYSKKNRMRYGFPSISRLVKLGLMLIQLIVIHPSMATPIYAMHTSQSKLMVKKFTAQKLNTIQITRNSMKYFKLDG